MIVPMKKVSLIIMGDKKDKTLKTLQKLGLLHVEIASGSGEKLAQLKDNITLLESAIFSVSGKKKENGDSDTSLDGLAVAQKINALEEQKKVHLGEIFVLNSETERLKNWGDINPDEIIELKNKGVDVSLYDMPLTEYDNLGENVKTIRLEKTKNSVKCLLINNGEDLDYLKTYKLELPKMSVADMSAKIANLNGLVQNIDSEIASYAVYHDKMKETIKLIEKDIEFEIYATGMDNEKFSSDNSNGITVSHFKGYIESENIDQLKKAAADNAWGLVVEDPTPDDNVPTKLKNNKFVSLIYPLTDFLGTVPGYFEYDISGWFLGFILIFFGIIFGDGGYGLLISSVAAIPIIKSLISKKPVSPLFLLVGLFGLSTILWGTLTCTWFGLSPEQLPVWLKSLSVPVISNVYADKIWSLPWTADGVGLTTAQNLQIFCFSLALVQLTVAHIKGFARNVKSLKCLGDLGSILQLVGIYYIVLSLVVNPEVFSFGLVISGIPVGTVAIALIGIGFVMSFVFANYEGSVIKAILSSLANIVSVLLGVVNVFSDIVSYIRLWAVGLAGAAISATVNELAGPLLGNFMFMIVAIILLVFGHGLNMILNVLSVIVHGIRLNTLEFSSHLDMSWSGHKFKPFTEKID